MLRESKHRRPKPHGLTLIELLVVIFIMMIFVAAAAPLVNPNTADRKIREASRQLNAYFAEAKAHAAQRGRPVGVAFDRAFALSEGTRDSNFISRMYLVEVPPIYTGDTLSSSVQFRCDANDQAGPFQPPTITVGGIPRPAIKLLLDPQQSPMLISIFQSYMPPGQTTGVAPFSIRMGGKGSYRAGYVVIDTTNATVPAKYYAWIVYGDPMYPFVSQLTTVAGRQTYSAQTFPVQNSVPLPLNNGGMPPIYYYQDSFQMGLPPIVSGDSQLELPTGTVVDLQFSGYSANGTEFFDISHNSPIPLAVIFTPGGSVELVQSTDPTNGGYSFSTPSGRLNFLVGTRVRDTETRDASVNDDRLTRIQNNAKTNLNDTASLWVSVNPRTGLVTTAENSIPQTITATTVAAAVYDSRFNSTKLNTKGGR